jgi:FKBP-type peptidyl-prolyl cis-trans isomerase
MARQTSLLTVSDKNPKLETEWEDFQRRSNFKRSPKLSLGNTGVEYLILKKGSGEKAGINKTAKIYYSAFFKDDWSTWDSNIGKDLFEFNTGSREVIVGFNITVIDMKKGEKRISLFPPHLAYGDSGPEIGVPADSSLVFEIELVDFSPCDPDQAFFPSNSKQSPSKAWGKKIF